MGVFVCVRQSSRDDKSQPDPFFLENGAEWLTLETMLKALEVEDEQLRVDLDVRYWDGEDLVILSSQEELDEAIRLTEQKLDILQLFVRPLNNRQPILSTLEEEEQRKERAPKRSAEEAFPSQATAEAESEVDPSAPAVVPIPTDALSNSGCQAPEAAASSVAASAEEVSSDQKQDSMDVVEDAGASEQEHQMVPGALSGANVIAIEMPECPVEVTMETPQEESRREPQGTEAAEPAEMAETGEVQPKSGRDAETGFWMVPKNENKEEKTPKVDKKPKDARPKDVRPKQRKSESKTDSGTDKPKKKKHQSDSALTLEVFHDYMGKCKTDMTRDIVKDVTKKTVRRVVDAVCKKTPKVEMAVQTSDEDDALAGQKQGQWPVYTHKGILCDNCDQTIVGPRYICGNCTNYDLCAKCEDMCPPVHDASHAFIKLRTPCPSAAMRHGVRSTLLKRMIYLPPDKRDEKRKEKTEHDKLIQLADRFKMREAKMKMKLAHKEEKLKRMLVDYRYMQRDGALSAKFVADVSYPDGSIVKPGQFVEKIWTMQNDGTFTWPPDTFLEEVRTTMPANKAFIPVGCVLPGRYAAISVDFVAPYYPGNYESHWRLYAQGRAFGHSLFCKICVKKAEPEKESDSSVVWVMWDAPTEENKEAKDEQGEIAASPAKTEKLDQEDRAYIKEFLGRNIDVHSKPVLTEGDSDAIIRTFYGEQSNFDEDTLPSRVKTPSTPNNTPFAVSPPSGRCVSPLPEETQACETPSAPSEVIEVFDQEASIPEELSLSLVAEASQSMYSQPLQVEGDFQILDKEQLETQGDDQRIDTTQQASAEADSEEDDDDNDSLPELLFCGNISCPNQAEAGQATQGVEESDGSEEEPESADEELYTAAASPQTSKLDANLEMPIVGPSPVMPCEEQDRDSGDYDDLPGCDDDDELPELMPVELIKKEQEAAVNSREMSPGSTTSSVEVVSLADLDEFEKVEDYTAIDTHGAWFSPSHSQPVCSECTKDDYDIPPEFYSDSDDSSIDSDFCVVLPDCFDTSKPLKTQKEQVKNMYLTMVKQNADKSGTGLAKESDAASLQEGFDKFWECCHEEAVNEDVLEPSRLQVVVHPPTEVEPEKSAEMPPPPSTDFGKMDQMKGYDVSKDLLQSNQEMDNLVEFLTTKMKKLGDTGDEDQEEAGKEEGEQAETPATAEDKQESSSHSGDGEAVDTPAAEHTQPAVDGEEETTLKTEMTDSQQGEEEEGATAAASTADIFDPGQQFNQLMQNTVKAASNGLQHLYKTTKDVIKTLQADNYEHKESTYKFKSSTFVPPKSTWKPPSTQYVPPRSDFQMPQSTYTGPKTPSSGKGGEYAEALQNIREMGFFNDERSLALLRKHNGDLAFALNDLFSDMDNDWADERH